MLIALNLGAQQEVTVPAVYSNIEKDSRGLYLKMEDGRKLYERKRDAYQLTLDAFEGRISGTEKGLALDFGKVVKEGRVYYGFIAKGDSKHPMPVYYKRTARIENGRAEINIDKLRGKYDMIGWEESGKGRMGYRVEDASGRLLYDGRVDFVGRGPFEVAPSLIEGPVVDMSGPDGIVISANVLPEAEVQVLINRDAYASERSSYHEISINGLRPNTSYDYRLVYGEDTTQVFSFSTAPKEGSRTAFTFAYASDSRSGQGGGERDVYGANHYIMKKIMALAAHREVAFMQFSGDLINGYVDWPGDIELQYANWKRAIEPFTHYLPVYEAMGITRPWGVFLNEKVGVRYL